MTPLVIQGGGPAGASAALAALRRGAGVTLLEKSRFPRHKVCGEFLSPGIAHALDRLGLASAFEFLRPATIRRMSIQVGGASKTANLPEPAFGLSRYALDAWLWREALAAGASHETQAGAADIVACGRQSSTPRGGRLFGFKAHFTGPVDDAVELYFAGRTYVGVNCVEDGITNVCGLAPEEELKRCGFQIDALVASVPGLGSRLAPLRRSWDWIFTGPLRFEQRMNNSDEAVYRCGDALSFVDPFTGSGLLCAIATGIRAGESAASKIPVQQYREQCARLLGSPFRFSSSLRWFASTRAAGPLLRLTPAALLFRRTRPLV